MSSDLAKKIRALLRNEENPMTIQEIALEVGARDTSVRRTLTYNMPDAYIKGWREAYRIRSTQLWAVVVPPPNAPMPALKTTSVAKNKARDTKPKEPRKVGRPNKDAQPKLTPQGLTFWQPVKPWPAGGVPL